MFIKFALENNVLKFGKFALKSERTSPYFFNIGALNTGEQLAILAEYYADMIVKSNIEFDVLFGPAYKGITLAAAVSMQLSLKYNKKVAYAFDRKEAKNHGEGGIFVGADMQNKKILLIDDVMTAGTAFFESKEKLKTINAEIVGVALAINRQEKAKDSDKSPAMLLESEYNVKVLAVTSFDEIFEYVKNTLTEQKIEHFNNYRKEYADL